MPNIFKSFLRPSVSNYVFPDAESIPVDEDPAPEEAADPSPSPEEEGAAPHREEGEQEQGAPAILEYARIQADEILKDARRQADQLLEQEREKIRQQAEEARAQARDEGYRQGYAEGLQQARVEGSAQLERQLRQDADRLRGVLEKVSAAREDMLEQTREELCELALAAAEKIIHISLRTSREVVVRMIQVATEKLRRREWVHIYVGGCEARELAQLAPELTRTLAGLSDHIKLIPMADDELGTLIIEMPDEIIDASASTQMNNIRDVLKSG